MNPLALKINFKNTLRFALPTICMMMFLSFYTIIDGMFVSSFVSTDALSSLNIVYPVINVVMGFGFMIVTGGSAIVSKKMGEKKEEEARQNFTFLYLISILFAICFAFFTMIFIDDILWMLGCNEILYKDAYTYLSIMIICMPICFMQIIAQFFFVTAGKPNLGLFTTIGGGITNIILDYVLIVVFNFGIAGAAIATVSGYSVAGITGLFYFKYNKKHSLYFVKVKNDFKMLKDACGNGVSEMVSNLSMAISTLLFNIMMMKLAGSDGIAAITIILYSQFLFVSIFLGYSSGIAPLYGYNFGEGNIVYLKKLFKTSIQFVLFFSIIIFISVNLFMPYVITLFSGDNQNVYAISMMGVFPYSFAFLPVGFNILASSMFTALSNGKVSAILSFVRTFVFITIFIIVLPQYFGILGIFLAIPLAELLSLAFTIYFIVRNRKQYLYY